MVSTEATFQALANQTRLEILKLLGRAGESSVYSSIIALTLGIRPSVASHHLVKLTEAGLVLRKKSGNHIFYTLNPRYFYPGEKDLRFELEIPLKEG